MFSGVFNDLMGRLFFDIRDTCVRHYIDKYFRQLYINSHDFLGRRLCPFCENEANISENNCTSTELICLNWKCTMYYVTAAVFLKISIYVSIISNVDILYLRKILWIIEPRTRVDLCMKFQLSRTNFYRWK